MQTNSKKQTAAEMCGGGHAGTEPLKMQKRIGSTTYEVSVHFSTTSTETIEDKILRLISNDAASRKAA